MIAGSSRIIRAQAPRAVPRRWTACSWPITGMAGRHAVRFERSCHQLLAPFGTLSALRLVKVPVVRPDFERVITKVVAGARHHLKRTPYLTTG